MLDLYQKVGSKPNMSQFEQLVPNWFCAVAVQESRTCQVAVKKCPVAVQEFWNCPVALKESRFFPVHVQTCLEPVLWLFRSLRTVEDKSFLEDLSCFFFFLSEKNLLLFLYFTIILFSFSDFTSF